MSDTPPPPPTNPTETPATETKTEAPTTLLTEQKDNASAPPPFDPEKLALPEGMEKTAEVEEFSTLAKEAGLSHPNAEKLLGLAGKAIQAAQSKAYEAWNKQNNDWQNEVKNDPELGGDKLKSVLQTVSKVLDDPKLSDPKFREALDYTGAGNNPAVVRTLYRWAQALSEGGTVAGQPGSQQQPRSLAEAIYPGGPHTGGPNLGG